MRNRKRLMMRRLREMMGRPVAPAAPAPAQTYDAPAEEVEAKSRIKSRKKKSIKKEEE